MPKNSRLPTMSDFQIGDLVRCKHDFRPIGVVTAFIPVPDDIIIQLRPDSGDRYLIEFPRRDLHKIAPLTIEDLRSHDFSAPLHAYLAWSDKVEECKILAWERSGEHFRLGLRIKGVNRDITGGETFATMKNFYRNKDDAISAMVWKLRERQAEHRRSIAKLEQQEREMLAGVSL
jgi:hypothetical protein